MPPAMSQATPLIYAELLSNIRQISVIVALDAPCDSTAKAELSADGLQFIFHQGDQTNTLNLPGQTIFSFQLQKPTLGNKELSWRLPLAGQASRASIEDAQSNEAPWSAKDLSGDVEFACRGCGAIVVKKRVRAWKDLPSENWAEMMDFWHCHKPDVPAAERNVGGSEGQGSPDAEKASKSKGYGASTKFVASSGIGLVDLATFLLHEADLINVKIVPSSTDVSTVNCNQCNAFLGNQDLQAQGVRLYKWHLSATFGPDKDPRTSLFVCAQLLALIQAQCTTKFLLHTDSQCHILIWVLSQSCSFSCLSSRGTSSQLAIKVFWRKVGPEEARELLGSEGVEDVNLSGGAVEIQRDLRESGQLLPPSSRTFKEWNVGLLERYNP